ncbi:DUF4468 domain-containing protein [Citrobacter koseri]|uniref:DUF4468 domain-containing protein n=1 Tax=Citrobacter koseri TaxID=545 RepID=UPI001C6273D1|nr:DUF4468 domain-containing protein [Citrobacter koseri]QYG83454.1 DUF4468 domain-containing protein [Citrobacter koseri]
MKKVMMKTVLASLVVSSITVLTGCVTSPDMEAAKQPLGSIVSVVNVPGVKKDALYSSSKIWVAKAFTDSNSVIQYADKEEGSIVGKGNVKYPCDGFNDCLANEDVRYKFTMKIDTKDDKARITFDDIHIYRPAHVTSGIAFPAIDSPNMTVGGQTKAKKALNDIVEQYKREIVTESSSAAKDW